MFKLEKGGGGDSSLGRFKPVLFDAASSATRDERMEVSICAEDDMEVSCAARAAAVAFLLSSSLENEGPTQFFTVENPVSTIG